MEQSAYFYYLLLLFFVTTIPRADAFSWQGPKGRRRFFFTKIAHRPLACERCFTVDLKMDLTKMAAEIAEYAADFESKLLLSVELDSQIAAFIAEYMPEERYPTADPDDHNDDDDDTDHENNNNNNNNNIPANGDSVESETVSKDAVSKDDDDDADVPPSLAVNDDDVDDEPVPSDEADLESVRKLQEQLHQLQQLQEMVSSVLGHENVDDDELEDGARNPDNAPVPEVRNEPNIDDGTYDEQNFNNMVDDLNEEEAALLEVS